MKIRFTLLLSLLLVSCCRQKYDLCVYGGTASGIVTARAAADMGMNVLVIEPTERIGGMTTGGLGQTDIGNKQVVKGLSLKFYRELGRRYGNLENWVFEPSAALEVLERFADSKNITIIKGYHLTDATVEDTRIKHVRAAGGERSLDTLDFAAKWFVDCSYEGDLMARAGVSYRVGREDNSEYGETWNGSQLLEGHQFPDGVDPFIVPGSKESGLLWGISDQQLKEDGKGDGLVQSYNFRICLTDSLENRIPITKPENYDPEKYELLARLYEAQKDIESVNRYFIWSLMPGRKTDINNRGGFSTDMIGMNYNYPEGTWEERQEIIKAHKDYTLGLLYFTATDPRVPEKIRSYVSGWGLPKDEYTESDHWSPQLYVRESRRLVGRYVATQADCENRVVAPEGIAYAAYTMDSHNCERIVMEKNGRYMVKNEGNVEIKGGLPYPISYRSITPKPEECTNLLVPVCCSASHIAYGSIRMEPVFMCLGQAAGIAVALADRQGLKEIQDVDYRQIADIIENDPFQDGSAPDVIIDDTDAVLTGEWTRVEGTKGFGRSWYETTSASASILFASKVAESGRYDVYTYLHLKDKKISDVAAYEFSNGEVFRMDMKSFSVSGQTSSAWQKIGEVDLEAGQEFTVAAKGSEDGKTVVADAVMLVKRGSEI